MGMTMCRTLWSREPPEDLYLKCSLYLRIRKPGGGKHSGIIVVLKRHEDIGWEGMFKGFQLLLVCRETEAGNVGCQMGERGIPL